MKNKPLKKMTYSMMATTLSISPFLPLTEAYAMTQTRESMIQEEEMSVVKDSLSYSPDESLVVEEELLSPTMNAEVEIEGDSDVEIEAPVELETEEESKPETESVLNVEAEETEEVLVDSMQPEVHTIENEAIQKSEVKNATAFSLSDWVYTQNSKYITITAAKNSKTAIYIPGEYNGKQIILKDLKIFPSTMTSLKISEVNGKKVLLDTDYLAFSFSNNKKLQTLDLRGLNTSNVTNMSYLFDGLENLTTINLNGWNTSKVTTMRSMFDGVKSLTSLNLSSFNTSRVEDMFGMFKGMERLTTLNIRSFNTSKVTDMSYMFRDLASMSALDVSMLNTANVEEMDYMFSGMSNLTTLNLRNFNTSKVKSMVGMFSGNKKLSSLNIKSFNTANVQYMGGMFQGMHAITALDLSHFNTSKVIRMEAMFNGMESLKTVNLSSFDTSKVTTMRGMFAWTGLTSLDLRHFDTGNVTDMSSMFEDNVYLTSVNMSGWDTENVTTMNSMFSEALALSSVDLSSFRTPKLEDVSYMFWRVPNLKILDLSHFDFSKVNRSSSFFYGMYDRPNQTLIIGQDEFLRNYSYSYATVGVVGIPEIFSTTTTISGKGTVGSRIEVSLNGKVLASTSISSTGAYSLTIPKQASGTKLVFKITTPEGVQTNKTVVVQNAFKNFTIKTTLAPSTTAIYGTGEPGAKVGVYSSNGSRLAVTTVNGKGNFKLVIPKQKVGTVLTFKQSKEGYVTVSKQGKVYQEFKTFTVPQVDTTSTALYGKGMPGAKVGIYTSTGKRLAITTVNSKGNFKLVIPKQKVGTVLTFKQAKSGYVTLSKEVKVLNQFKTFTVPQINSTSTALYGKGTPGAKVGIYTTSGKRLAITTVNSKGNYKLVIPKQKVGTVLTFKQAKSGYVTLSKEVKVLNQFKTFTVPQIRSTSTALYGKGTPGAKVGIYTSNGKRLAITTVNSKGNYKLVIPKQKAGTVVEVKMAKNGYQTLSQKVKVIK